MLSDIYIKSDFKLFRFSIWQLIIPLIIGLLITLIAYPQGFLSVKTMAFVVIYSLSIGIPFMKTYEYFEWKIEQRIPWLERPGLRFFWTVFIQIIIGIFILALINYLFFIVIQKEEMNTLFAKTLVGLKYMASFIILSVILVNASLFFKNWKQSAINEEKLKREKLAIEYEALKNQVNPHFLFNSLTALSSLVYTDQQKAAKFIGEFANVLRYVLEFREKEMVDFATEKKLLVSLIYLYQIRHEDGLQINLDLSGAIDKFLIPMALQMLLENAIKHNAISIGKPLMVDIWAAEDYVVVKNNIQPKKSEILSNKIGLHNIISRYKYLSGKEVYIEITKENFTVKIPILRLKNV
jgi:sensor histidine kinase YesM